MLILNLKSKSSTADPVNETVIVDYRFVRRVRDLIVLSLSATFTLTVALIATDNGWTMKGVRDLPGALQAVAFIALFIHVLISVEVYLRTKNVRPHDRG
jgi:hypothetical protein